MTTKHAPLPLTMEALREADAGGASFKYIHFWSHRPRARSVDESCLSQWYPATFACGGCQFATAEHWMMAEKARLFDDEQARKRILAAKDPGAAKAIGREVAGFEQARWAEERVDIVRRGSLAKFSQHPELKAFLIATKQRVLVEASPKDSIWGSGLAKDSPEASDPSRWPGLNLLGFALMWARSELLARRSEA